MSALIKKIHMYTGLLSFTSLLVFGIYGLYAALEPAPEDRPPPRSTTRYVDFEIPGGLTDKQLADRIYETLRIPLSSPVPEWAIEHDEAGNLLVAFYTVNGPRRVIVHEAENRLEIRSEAQTLGRFLGNVHAGNFEEASPDLRTMLWAGYLELSTWSLIFMSCSGVYLWLVSRPRSLLARVSLGAGSGIFVLLWVLTR